MDDKLAELARLIAALAALPAEELEHKPEVAPGIVWGHCDGERLAVARDQQARLLAFKAAARATSAPKP